MSRPPHRALLRDPGWGLPYGGIAYQTERGALVWLWHKGQKCRWYNARGRRIGPEQSNVAPAIAYAHHHGWLPDEGAVNAMDYFDVPPSEGMTPHEQIAASNLRRGSRRPSKRERQYKHVLASERAAGRSESTATRIAAATVNKTRRRLARKGRGPQLVTEGGSRRQWYPGKEAKRARSKR